MPQNLDELTAKVVTFVELVSKRAVGAATVVLATVAGIVVATTLLGVVVLGGPLRSFFLVLAITFGSIAIGAAWIGRWRLGVSGRELPQLTNELRQLLATNPEARAAVDTFTATNPSDGPLVDAYVAGDSDGEIIIAETNPLANRSGVGPIGAKHVRVLIGLRSLAGEGISKFGAIAAVVGGARSYPFLAFWSVVITFGFAAVGVVLFFAYVIGLLIG